MPTYFDTESLTGLHWAAIVLAFITGVIHLGLGISSTLAFGPQPLELSFILAGLGFFGAIILFLRDYHRQYLYLGGIGYTALQIVLWFLINQQADPAVSPLEGIDKTAQVLLILTLVVLYRRHT